ncbi:ABC transporter substrate-binding protein [Caldicellulosiruptor acetigenus]|uniref:ABC transporter substrate-binding protein n=1 Tax=Caldicellulosiruptor acetigenus TaxID=301953 RepID=UPI000492D115
MKKFIAIIMVFALLFSIPLFAFSSKSTSTKKKIVLGFAQIGAESEWRTANTKSIKEAAAKEGIILKFVDCQQKQENQIKAIRSFIAQRVDVIAFSPVVETGWDTVLKEAKDAGIPVILVDRTVKVSDPNLYVCWIGDDFVEEGRKAARWLVDYMTNKLKWKGTVNIAELVGTVGSAPANDRAKGFRDVIKKYPNFKIIVSQSGDFTRAKGKEVMEAWLKTDLKKKINVLFAHNDDMALGAIQAIEEAGLRPGKDIIIVSIDAVKGAFEAMIAGKLNCTVECTPLLGPLLMKTVKDLMSGKKVPRKICPNEGVFPAEVAKKVLPTRQY